MVEFRDYSKTPDENEKFWIYTLVLSGLPYFGTISSAKCRRLNKRINSAYAAKLREGMFKKTELSGAGVLLFRGIFCG